MVVDMAVVTNKTPSDQVRIAATNEINKVSLLWGIAWKKSLLSRLFKKAKILKVNSGVAMINVSGIKPKAASPRIWMIRSKCPHHPYTSAIRTERAWLARCVIG